ncbi:MAG: META domain-containing protein [Rhodoferax sp.]
MVLKIRGVAVCALFLAVALGGCAALEPAAVAIPVTSTELLSGEWVAFAVDGVEEVVFPKPKLRWTGPEQVSGTGGCNAFAGKAVVGPQGLRIGPLKAMGKPCLTLPGGQEDRFFQALEQTRKARLERDQLVLVDATGKTLARLLKANGTRAD